MAGRPRRNMKGHRTGDWVVVSRVMEAKVTTWKCQCVTCHKTKDIRHDCLSPTKVPGCKNCKTSVRKQREILNKSNASSGFVKGGLSYGRVPVKRKKVIDPVQQQKDIGLREAKLFLAAGRSLH